MTQTGEKKLLSFASNDAMSSVFGHNIPSRTKFVRICEKYTKKEQLSNGDHLARHLTVHWENETKKIRHVRVEDSKLVQLNLPAKIGSFFSLSWAINDEILQQYEPRNIISLGFEDVRIIGKELGDFEIFGNLNLIKGKSHVKQVCRAGYFEGRIQASFNMSENEEMWLNGTRGWIDFVFANPDFKLISILKPMIWVQSKLSI